MAKKSNKPACLVITFNSRLHDMKSIENFVGQFTISLIRNLVFAYCHVQECRSSAYEVMNLVGPE